MTREFRFCRPHSALATLVAGLVTGLAGCTTIIRPPAEPCDPAVILVADSRYHSSLILPRDEGGLLEYSFGEWKWYALGQKGGRLLSVLAIPHTGTLGRAEYSDLAAVRAKPRLDALYPIEVPRDAMVALRARLESTYLAGQASQVYNPQAATWYVPMQERYWLFHDCNDVLARWLRDLGCRVPRVSRTARFRVVP